MKNVSHACPTDLRNGFLMKSDVRFLNEMCLC